MQDLITTTGIILKTVPAGEYDRRLVILTNDRGKITAFVRGARRPNSKFLAATNLFCFGNFRLYEGKSAYNVSDIEITNYFEELRENFENAYYGMYFLELADYYTRENNDEKEMLKLLYQSLRALSVTSLSNRLVKAIYEYKTIMINGEFPGIPAKIQASSDTIYAIDYVYHASIEKLYTFTLSEEVLNEFLQIIRIVIDKTISKKFQSLTILETLVD